MADLTELEALALACTHRYEACTAHFVRRLFQISPAARFSSSAGAIYPLMRRLERRGLASSETRREGRREVRRYRATEAGRRALRAWLGPAEDVGRSYSIDPLRTQMIFLGALTPAERSRWLDAAEATLRRLLEAIDVYEAAFPDRDLFYDLAVESSRRATRMRLAWLRDSRRRLAAAGLLGEEAAPAGGAAASR